MNNSSENSLIIMIYIYSSVLNMKVSRRDLLVQFTSRLEEHKC